MDTGLLSWGFGEDDPLESLRGQKKKAEDELRLEWSDEEQDQIFSENKVPPLSKYTIKPKDGQIIDGGDDVAENGELAAVVTEDLNECADIEEFDEDSDEVEGDIDVMACQLKFIACLRIIAEELNTLATGAEVSRFRIGTKALL
ncbi:unnamed protein product [Protopolystoma xenopodis]|uniref:Uncharacterized protein n=1 Tax=Protopolystoma xenopodis TaxID=117903 RepID=A0A3S5FDP6_9PLAT|nr:unnamed protein product [Protopolystoma xenopodis]